MRQHLRLLITGGAGFIGSHVVRWFVNRYPNYDVYVLDALTYAGHLENLTDIKPNHYTFIHLDLRKRKEVFALVKKLDLDAIIHLAAESHVDRSIDYPMTFLETNVLGTAHLLEAAREAWQVSSHWRRFYHISTDEVYGTLGREGCFTPQSPYRPRSPYSASKAAADHLVAAYANTYQLPTLMSHCANNYGPYQFPEKLIPLTLLNLIANKETPLYGKGEHRRDWLYVEDHARAIDDILHKGRLGAVYHIGADNECANKDLVAQLATLLAERTGKSKADLLKLVKQVKDRPGHDFRYAVDTQPIREELGWTPQVKLQEGLQRTMEWYLSAQKWIADVKKNAQERKKEP